MTMREIPSAIRAVFNDSELSDIAAHPIIRADGSDADAIDLAVAWDLHVQKIDQDRALPWSDRTVWTEHDLAGALFIRDALETSLAELPPSVAERMRGYIATSDEQFRSFTVDDSGDRIAKIACVDVGGRPWWWFRVPSSGPIAEDLARY
ncbi:MAG TPA: hypothetical protein VH008_14685 [Pseudonocardia sp.]|nr:hypothetical protein [Pseudonocardia sp.]